jgi:hypothetical protein
MPFHLPFNIHWPQDYGTHYIFMAKLKFFVFNFCFISPVRRLDQLQASGGLGED